MDYTAALSRLLALVDFERFAGPRGPRVKFSLDRMSALLRSLGEPHIGIPTVHIAGTKGKGSTTAIVASVLSRQGYITGMFISPHLHTFRERICINGKPVSEDEFSSLVDEIWPHLEKINKVEEHGTLTLFETLTAMAFLQFRRADVDFQVLEVGLGGRLDSTNLVSPRVCAITSVSLDHTAILGDNIEKISLEKSGIVKPGVPTVVAPQSAEAKAVIRRVCRQNSAPFVDVGTDIKWLRGPWSLDGQSFKIKGRLGNYQLKLPLLGDHQLENAATAVGLLESLIEQGWPISGQAMSRGFADVKWPCRMEVLQKKPLVVVDGAHNPYSMRRLCEALRSYFEFKKLVIVFGCSKDKNMEDMVNELGQLKPLVVVTRSRHPRSVSPFILAQIFQSKMMEVRRANEVSDAMKMAQNLVKSGDMILVTGSLFVAAEAREDILGIESERYSQFDVDQRTQL